MLALIAEFTGLLLVIFVCSVAMSIAVEKLAERWGANFSGSILLGLVTVLPEYLIVFFAVKKGEYDGAVGAVTGAAAMLVTIGYGLVILTATSRFSRKPVEVIELSPTTRIDALYLFLTAIVAIVLALIGDGLGMVDAAILTLIFIAYVIHLGLDAAKKSKAQAKAGQRTPVFWPLVALAVSGGLVVAVAEPFVESMIGLAEGFGVPHLAIFLILSPIASEMPEKLTAFVTVRRDGKLAEISVCNFIGSKINHNSLLPAMMPLVALLYGRGGLIPHVAVPAFWMMTGLTLIAGFSLSLGRLRHWQGWFFTALFLLMILVAIVFPEGPTAAMITGH